MGEIIEWNGKIREVVKVKSDNPGHAGFYTTFRDAMKPGDEEYVEGGNKAELTVKQIKEQITALGIVIPPECKKKEDLQALLDSAKE